MLYIAMGPHSILLSGCDRKKYLANSLVRRPLKGVCQKSTIFSRAFHISSVVRAKIFSAGARPS